MINQELLQKISQEAEETMMKEQDPTKRFAYQCLASSADYVRAILDQEKKERENEKVEG